MRYPHTVTIQRPTAATDDYGDPALDWTSPSSTPSRAWVQPRTTSEDNRGRTAVLTGWMVFLPPDVDLAPSDRIVWEGRTYEVDGEPAVLWDPGGPHHVEVNLRRVTG